MPDNNITRALVEMAGVPLVSTSIHDEEDEIMDYLSDAELIHEKFSKSVDLVINGGFGSLEPTTVIDCTSGHPELIREGKGVISHLF